VVQAVAEADGYLSRLKAVEMLAPSFLPFRVREINFFLPLGLKETRPRAAKFESNLTICGNVQSTSFASEDAYHSFFSSRRATRALAGLTLKINSPLAEFKGMKIKQNIMGKKFKCNLKLEISFFMYKGGNSNCRLLKQIKSKTR